MEDCELELLLEVLLTDELLLLDVDETELELLELVLLTDELELLLVLLCELLDVLLTLDDELLLVLELELDDELLTLLLLLLSSTAMSDSWKLSKINVAPTT